MPAASTSSSVGKALRTSVPKYKPSASSRRLPPARLTVFRSVVAHPPAPFAVEQQQQNAGKGKEKSLSPLSGPQQITYMTAPRPFIPLTNSPTNHKLWNPPAPDAKGSRQVEKDESGRLARFANKFSFAAQNGRAAPKEGDDKSQFDVESDLSFLEGTTLQSPGTALGKRDIV
ncbi:hypothetical protein OIV83_003332 [Microbotryomycetes sp. JL201]|nr:hypothetical protein OIV83_003332 [Microbotryomycetes sp. JL201]